MISKGYMHLLSLLLILVFILFLKVIDYDQSYSAFVVIFFEAVYIKTINRFRCCGMRNNPGTVTVTCYCLLIITNFTESNIHCPQLAAG